jgi:hypothetical protein
VRIGHGPSGRVVTSLTPGSPHYGEPVQTIRTPGHIWVIPALATGVRERLDPAVFDVTALARTPQVSLRLTFARNVSPRSLPGLTLATHGARTLPNGRTTAVASYDARRPLPASLISSLRGVARVAPARSQSPATAGYQLHRLTIRVKGAHGTPLPFGSVFLLNTHDARLFAYFGAVIDGQWKVRVPQGHYLAFVNDARFHYALVGQARVSDGDAHIHLAVAHATVRPKVGAPPGFVRSFADLEVLGFDSKHHSASYSVGLSGAAPRLTPLTHAAGRLTTEVSTTWTPRGFGPKSHRPVSRVVMSKFLRHGIPPHLVFPYQPRRYADVTIASHATGTKRQRQTTSMYALDRRDNAVAPTQVTTARPGILHARLLGGKNLGWFVSSAFTAGRNQVDMEAIRKFRRGQHAVLPLFRGPLAPFTDRTVHDPKMFGPRICPVCVVHGALTGFSPLISSAGTSLGGDITSGRFAVFSGHRRLVAGIAAIRPEVAHVEPGERLRLVTSTTSPGKDYTLSSRVHDVFRFRVPKTGHGPVPVLRASYVPPANLSGVGPAGPVAFPITFDNIGPAAARVSHAKVRWSTDGKSWHRARLSRLDKNTFQVHVRNPTSTASQKYVDLEVQARDAAGRSVSESVTHAYLLPARVGRATGSGSASGSTPRTLRVGNLCGKPTRHRHACFVQLAARPPGVSRGAARPDGWGAGDLADAYRIGSPAGTPGTIAVIDAYGYPHAEADMNAYRAHYGLPACTTSNGCFQKLNQRGDQSDYPKPDAAWGVETALDLQMVSAACRSCHIILVEANNAGLALDRAERTAVNAGATVTSHSFGILETHGVRKMAGLYDHPGVTAVASTGDDGYGPPNFPASSPKVVAVGGTVLERSDPSRRDAWAETAWAYSASGCSAYFAKPKGQADTRCSGRMIADISAVAEDLAIYDTSVPKPDRGWLTVDGTSASAPLVAGMIALAGGGGLRPSLLYADRPQQDFNDVTSGSNGFCRRSYLCTGVPGYDGPTGLGTPSSPAVFAPPA